MSTEEKIIRINEDLCKMTKFKPEDLLNKNYKILMTKNIAKKHTQYIDNYLSNGFGSNKKNSTL